MLAFEYWQRIKKRSQTFVLAMNEKKESMPDNENVGGMNLITKKSVRIKKNAQLVFWQSAGARYFTKCQATFQA